MIYLKQIKNWITDIATEFLKRSNNLSDLTNASTARGNLGLGDAATKDVGTGSANVAQGNHLHTGVYAPNSHVSDTNNPHSVNKADVGLGNCDNTSDMNKPVSTAQGLELATKADRISGGTTGNIVSRDANGNIQDSGKKFNDAGEGTNDIWSGSKVSSAIAAGVSGVSVTGYQVIETGPTTPATADSEVTITGVFESGKLPHASIKPVVSINGILIPEGAVSTTSNRWERSGNDLKLKVPYALNSEDEIVVVYSY